MYTRTGVLANDLNRVLLAQIVGEDPPSPEIGRAAIWHRGAHWHGGRDEPPYVLFVCQDAEQREQFLRGADHQLTGHRWHPSAPREQHHHLGRRRILFAVETDAHRGLLEAWRLPGFPPGNPARNNNVHSLVLAGSPPPAAAQAQLRLSAAA